MFGRDERAKDLEDRESVSDWLDEVGRRIADQDLDPLPGLPEAEAGPTPAGTGSR